MLATVSLASEVTCCRLLKVPNLDSAMTSDHRSPPQYGQ